MTQGRDFLGDYRLVRLIRAGQTCQVWEALNDTDSTRVALKALQPELRDSKEEIAYLRHEYEVAHKFDHPNVIKIYGFHTDKQVPFLVMELNMGKNLKLAMRQGVEEIAYMVPKLIERAAEALHYMHQQGWVHRDVKPDNFLISDDPNEMKLIDFALAQRVPSGLARLFGGKSKVQGTRSYMAPEQIRGKLVDPRADIYSFGCVIYEMLAGKPPYSGATPADLLNKHLIAPVPSMLASNNNVTPEFNALVMQMMAKKPEERPSDLDEFLRVFRRTRIFKAMPKAPASVRENPQA